MASSKIALITGASRGIGRACARLFSKHRFQTVLVSRTRSDLDNLKDEIESEGGQAAVFPTDLRSLQQIEELKNKVKDRVGVPDVLIHAAGAWHDDQKQFKGPDFDEIPADELDVLLDIELRATMQLTRVFLAEMKPRRSGKIVNLSCGFAGPHEAAGWVHYYTANEAIAAFTRGLAAEMRRHHIQVNAVAPWFVRSEAVVQFFPNDSQNALETMDVANLILFLASDESRHISGQTIEIRSSWDV